MVAEAAEPGATVSMVARRHAIHSSLLFRWRRDAQAGERAVTASSPPMFVSLALPGPVELPRPAPAAGRSVIEALVGR